METSQRVAVLPVSFGWSDVGNWRSVHEALASNPEAVELLGPAKSLASRRSLVIADGTPVRVIGLDGIAVIAAKDGVLVTSLDKAADIKSVLD
jgi:mannose-1-phosphate guanylyltransferase